VALNCFPGGINICDEPSSIKQQVEFTKTCIKKKKTPLYNATFAYKNTVVVVDIMTLDKGVWNLYDVKI